MIAWEIMRLTNKFNLPDAFVRATRRSNAAYDSKADRSVTQLINPPQIDLLRKRYFRDMEKDVSEEFFALLGSAVHKILEWGAVDGVTEERLHASVSGWAISGGIDLQLERDHYVITDYKVTSVYVAFKDETKPEWEQQLNCYAYLVWLNKGITVQELRICAILRDWMSKNAREDIGYPQSPITLIDIPVWSRARQEAYIKERVALHQTAEMVYELEGTLPPCSPDERWMTGDKWAVRKPGNKKASKVCGSQEEAEQELEKIGRDKAIIEYREGRSVRCGYCQVSQWCEQYKSMTSKEDEVGNDE